MGWPIVGVLTFRRRRLFDRRALAQGGRVHVPRHPSPRSLPTGAIRADARPDPRRVDHGALSSQKMRGMP